VRSASQLLERCGAEVTRATNLQEGQRALETELRSLVIVDVPHFRGAQAMLEIGQASLPTIAMTSGEDLEELRSLVCDVGISNVIANPGASRAALTELLITADKLLRDDLFGLHKYLRGEGAQLQQRLLTGACDRDRELRELSHFLRTQKAPRPLIPTIVNAADEMLTNAMYNAPVSSSGSPRYASVCRRTKIELSAAEHVELKYGVHKGVFGISVSDNFGRLRLGHLSKSIHRCLSDDDPIEQKAGGAGLGLFLIARTAQQFIINVDPGERSEVIGLWVLDRNSLRSERSHHSLHFFEQAYQLASEIQPSRCATGTRGPRSDYDNQPVTLRGLGFRSTHSAPASHRMMGVSEQRRPHSRGALPRLPR
jgi:CheY-like chemotaxis protein